MNESRFLSLGPQAGAGRVERQWLPIGQRQSKGGRGGQALVGEWSLAVAHAAPGCQSADLVVESGHERDCSGKSEPL